MLTTTYSFLAGFLVLLVSVNCSSRFKFSKFVCSIKDAALVQNVTCFARPTNRSSTSISFSATITRPVDDVYIHVQMFKKAEIKYRPFLVNMTANFCEYLKTKRGSVYLRMVVPLILPFSNLDHACPIVGNIYVKGFSLDSTKLPAMWPEGFYRVDVGFNVGKSKAFDLAASVEITEA